MHLNESYYMFYFGNIMFIMLKTEEIREKVKKYRKYINTGVLTLVIFIIFCCVIKIYFNDKSSNNSKLDINNEDDKYLRTEELRNNKDGENPTLPNGSIGNIITDNSIKKSSKECICNQYPKNHNVNGNQDERLDGLNFDDLQEKNHILFEAEKTRSLKITDFLILEARIASELSLFCIPHKIYYRKLNILWKNNGYLYVMQCYITKEITSRIFCENNTSLEVFLFGYRLSSNMFENIGDFFVIEKYFCLMVQKNYS